MSLECMLKSNKHKIIQKYYFTALLCKQYSSMYMEFRFIAIILEFIKNKIYMSEPMRTQFIMTKWQFTCCQFIMKNQQNPMVKLRLVF